MDLDAKSRNEMLVEIRTVLKVNRVNVLTNRCKAW